MIIIAFLFIVFIFQPILSKSLYHYWNDLNSNGVFDLKKYKKKKEEEKKKNKRRKTNFLSNQILKLRLTTLFTHFLSRSFLSIPLLFPHFFRLKVSLRQKESDLNELFYGKCFTHSSSCLDFIVQIFMSTVCLWNYVINLD